MVAIAYLRAAFKVGSASNGFFSRSTQHMSISTHYICCYELHNYCYLHEKLPKRYIMDMVSYKETKDSDVYSLQPTQFHRSSTRLSTLPHSISCAKNNTLPRASSLCKICCIMHPSPPSRATQKSARRLNCMPSRNRPHRGPRPHRPQSIKRLFSRRRCLGSGRPAKHNYITVLKPFQSELRVCVCV